LTVTKLDKIGGYIENMAPVNRPAMLFPILVMAEHKGWDEAMFRAQQDLLAILDGPDG
jgi:hypothetical protein